MMPFYVNRLMPFHRSTKSILPVQPVACMQQFCRVYFGFLRTSNNSTTYLLNCTRHDFSSLKLNYLWRSPRPPVSEFYVLVISIQNWLMTNGIA